MIATTRAKLRTAALRQWSDPEARARILAGQRAARLFRENEPLASWAARRYMWSGLDFDDLRQAALLGLHRAARRFDPERGATFSTVAAWYMFAELRREVAGNRGLARMPADRLAEAGPKAVSIDGDEEGSLVALLPTYEEDGPEVGAGRALLRERVAEALGSLRERDRFVVEHRFGITGSKRPHTLDEIAAEMGVSRERVRQIETRALGRLRFRLPRE